MTSSMTDLLGVVGLYIRCVYLLLGVWMNTSSSATASFVHRVVDVAPARTSRAGSVS